MFCDLHVHSTASDGTVRPVQLASLAKAMGLGAMALTDHDTTEGLAECEAACAATAVAFVPGIEVSADPGDRSKGPGSRIASQGSACGGRLGTLHVLGLFVQHDNPQLRHVHERMREARDSRNPAIVAKLNDLGIQIHYDEVLDLARQQGTRIVGRPHIAAVLIRKGYVKSVHHAFAQYIGQGGAAYVRRDRLLASDTIDAIHHAGGLAILAHPIQLGLKEPGDLEHFVASLKDLGLDGIETHHGDHDALMARQYTQLAKRFDLLVSGGSDFHGSRKSIELGSQRVPIEVYNRLRDAWTQKGLKGT